VAASPTPIVISRYDAKAATVQCNEREIIIDNRLTLMYDHASIDLDQLKLYRCQLCIAFTSSQYSNVDIKTHLRDAHQSIDARQFDDNRYLYEAEYDKALCNYYGYDDDNGH
jgi:hypothetical protein